MCNSEVLSSLWSVCLFHFCEPEMSTVYHQSALSKSGEYGILIAYPLLFTVTTHKYCAHDRGYIMLVVLDNFCTGKQFLQRTKSAFVSSFRTLKREPA